MTSSPMETPEQIAADEALVDIAMREMPDIYPPIPCTGCENWQIDFPMDYLDYRWAKRALMEAYDEHIAECPKDKMS